VYVGCCPSAIQTEGHVYVGCCPIAIQTEHHVYVGCCPIAIQTEGHVYVGCCPSPIQTEGHVYVGCCPSAIQTEGHVYVGCCPSAIQTEGHVYVGCGPIAMETEVAILGISLNASDVCSQSSWSMCKVQNCDSRILKGGSQPRWPTIEGLFIFLFRGSASCCAHFIKVIVRTVSATTVQGIYLYLYFAATCFGLRWPSSGGIHNILGKLPLSQWIRWHMLLLLFVCLFVYCLGFEIFTAVSIKNAAFWDGASCGFIISRRFRGTCHLHFEKKFFLLVFGTK
jgi:hypothetical protein